jgi:hypothetical protein
MYNKSKEFFAQPDSAKSEFAIHSEQAGGLNRGWVKMEGESLDPSGQKVRMIQLSYSLGSYLESANIHETHIISH